MHKRETIGFSGSYKPDSVTFLLQRIQLQPTEVAEKEHLIQSGKRHYSEMISLEKAPTETYQQIFADAVAAGRDRMGREVAEIALALKQSVEGQITLASLVRAGVPLGILLTRALRHIGADVAHFGISIIRDRGLDENALTHILERRPIEGLVFVDGWTGKGAIATELERDFTRLYGIAPRLVVLADPCGRAWLAASGDDWLIPSGILGSTVSGLISRSILNETTIASGGFHGCVQWDHLAAFDTSEAFIDLIWEDVLRHLPLASAARWTREDRRRQHDGTSEAISWVADRHGVTNPNRVKPGIAEATRAVLRRAPERVYVGSLTDPDLTALIHLCKSINVPIELAPSEISPYRAITLIAKVH